MYKRQRRERYRKAIEGKRDLTSGLRQKNYQKLDSLDRVEVLTGLGSFVDSHHVQVTMAVSYTHLDVYKRQ